MLNADPGTEKGKCYLGRCFFPPSGYAAATEWPGCSLCLHLENSQTCLRLSDQPHPTVPTQTCPALSLASGLAAHFCDSITALHLIHTRLGLLVTESTVDLGRSSTRQSVVLTERLGVTDSRKNQRQCDVGCARERTRKRGGQEGEEQRRGGGDRIEGGGSSQWDFWFRNIIPEDLNVTWSSTSLPQQNPIHVYINQNSSFVANHSHQVDDVHTWMPAAAPEQSLRLDHLTFNGKPMSFWFQNPQPPVHFKLMKRPHESRPPRLMAALLM